MNAFSMFLIVLFVLVIIMTTGSSCYSPAPHHADTIFAKSSTFEGFGGSVMDFIIKPEQKEQETPKTHASEPAAYAKVIGFDGLFVSPNETHSKLDKFADTEGKPECKSSYGLSNSTGRLCLNAEQVHLLRTRGGNMNDYDRTNSEI
jgi:hypothetical protein